MPPMRNLMIRGILFILVLFAGGPAVSQNTLFDIIYCLNGGENKSVGLPSVALPNPPEKEGWNLIFSDEFNGTVLDPLKWNRSTPFDDGIGSCTRKFAVNPANVALADGAAVISNTITELIPGCPFSSGEIKSMSVRDTSFKSYYFYASGFLEARVKLYSKPGQGASMWLWGIGDPLNPGGEGPWNEIDVFELDGANANIADGTYHWTWDGKHVSQVQNVYLTQPGGLYDLTENWTIFSVEWEPDTIRWYINNVLVKELDLHRIPPFCLEAGHYSKALAPFCLRFGSGPNTVGNMTNLAQSSDLPQSMLIDYVRVYKRNHEKATPILTTNGINQICFDTANQPPAEKEIWTPYYPEVTYEWSSPSFDLIPVDFVIPRPPGKMVIRTKPGITPDQAHPVYLKTQFPGNRTEYDTLMVFLATSPPPLPVTNFTPAPIDTLCYYEILKPASPFVVSAEYSTNGGVTWKKVGRIEKPGGSFFCFDTLRPESSHTFRWREWNICGVSPEVEATITAPLPEPGCKWPTGKDELIHTGNSAAVTVVSVSPCPVTEKLTIILETNPVNNQYSTRLCIYDCAGRMLLQQNLNDGENSTDLGFIKPGLFLIRIVNGTELIYHNKCIRQ